MTGIVIERAEDHCIARFRAMAGPCALLIDTDDESLARHLAHVARDEALRTEHKFSRYRDDNIVARLNRAQGDTVEVDNETAGLLDYADTCFRLSEGRFDITTGVLRRVWRFDGSCSQKSFTSLISIVLLQPLLKTFLNTGLYKGYVDIAVAFFTFASLYILLKAHGTSDIEQRSRLYILGAIFTAGAAISKQTGIYIALCYPVLVYADVYFSKYPLDKKRIRAWLGLLALISLVWVSWYVFKSIAVADPEAFDTYLSLSENRYDNVNLFSRMITAIGRHREFVVLFLLIATSFPCMDRFYKVLTILFAPFPFIWAGLASYDTRNLATFLPVLVWKKTKWIQRYHARGWRAGSFDRALGRG